MDYGTDDAKWNVPFWWVQGQRSLLWRVAPVNCCCCCCYHHSKSSSSWSLWTKCSKEQHLSLPCWEILKRTEFSLCVSLYAVPVTGRMSSLWRLFRRGVGNAPPLESRRCRLDSMAAGDTMHGGGTFPIRTYNSSISRFCTACRVCTSHKCLRERERESERTEEGRRRKERERTDRERPAERRREKEQEREQREGEGEKRERAAERGRGREQRCRLVLSTAIQSIKWNSMNIRWLTDTHFSRSSCSSSHISSSSLSDSSLLM